MQREEVREMFGLLADQGVGSIPYAPLAKGRLARRWGEHTQRFDVDPVGRRFDIDSDRPIVDAVHKIAEARGIPMAQVALAWVLRNPVVTAPIVGPTNSIIFPTPWQGSTSTSPTTKSAPSRSPTVHICRFLGLLAHRAWSPPPSSSLAEERAPLLAPSPCGGARFPTLAATAF